MNPFSTTNETGTASSTLKKIRMFRRDKVNTDVIKHMLKRTE